MATSSSPPAGSSTPHTWRFDAFELDERAGELRKDGVAVKLQPQPFIVLALLVERSGELVLREELKRALWGEDTYVDFERGLNFCINQVRSALGDSAEQPRFVQTVPRRGYRFISPVRRSEVEAGSEASPAEVRGKSEASQKEVEGSSEAGRTAPPAWQFLLTGVAFLTILAAGATFLAHLTSTAPATPTRTMIAVLPLEDLTGDPPPPWFADGLTEEMITQLGRASPNRLGVIARTSAMAYRGSSKSIADIGRELGVSHVLEGSVRRDGVRLRVTVQLVAVSDQAPVWSESYDRTIHAALSIQSEVAAQVTRALAVELLDAPWTSPTWTATRTPAARDAFLRATYLLNRGTAADARSAIGHLEQAIQLDPAFGAAHAAFADACHRLAMAGLMSARDAYAQAAKAADAALRVDPNLADAHAARGIVHLWAEWNPTAAAASFQRALALNPSNASAHHDLAWAFVALERFDDAIAHITRARELDPLSTRANNDIGWLYLHIRQPSEAARACRQALAIDPDSIEAQQCLERAHLQRGELTEALAAARAAADRSPVPVPTASEENASPRDRIDALWRRRLERLQMLSAERRVSPYTLAMHHIVVGQDEQALARLEDAFEARASMMVLLPGDPLFDRLRTNPRFLRLLDRIRHADREIREKGS